MWEPGLAGAVARCGESVPQGRAALWTTSAVIFEEELLLVLWEIRSR
ncbi:hypothetical protein JOD54_001747 [Actinokineospora baliensis]|nr:hypothetical protein [Actinokineospora baliensis]